MKRCPTCNEDVDNEKHNHCFDCWFDLEYKGVMNENVRKLFVKGENGVFYVYLLKCFDKNDKVTYYCGYTSRNPKMRLNEHLLKKGAKYTAKQKTLVLVYLEKYKDIGTAMRREQQIKILGLKYKLGLIDGIKRALKEDNSNPF